MILEYIENINGDLLKLKVEIIKNNYTILDDCKKKLTNLFESFFILTSQIKDQEINISTELNALIYPIFNCKKTLANQENNIFLKSLMKVIIDKVTNIDSLVDTFIDLSNSKYFVDVFQNASSNSFFALKKILDIKKIDNALQENNFLISDKILENIVVFIILNVKYIDSVNIYLKLLSVFFGNNKILSKEENFAKLKDILFTIFFHTSEIKYICEFLENYIHIDLVCKIISESLNSNRIFYYNQNYTNKIYKEVNEQNLLFFISSNIDVKSSKKNLELLSKISHKYHIKCINYTDNSGYSVLHHACAFKRFEIVEKLLTFNMIDINVKKDFTGETPLDLAINNKDYDMAKFLLRNNASIDISKVLKGTYTFFIALYVKAIIKNSGTNDVSFYKKGILDLVGQSSFDLKIINSISDYFNEKILNSKNSLGKNNITKIRNIIFDEIIELLINIEKEKLLNKSKNVIAHNLINILFNNFHSAKITFSLLQLLKLINKDDDNSLFEALIVMLVKECSNEEDIIYYSNNFPNGENILHLFLKFNFFDPLRDVLKLITKENASNLINKINNSGENCFFIALKNKNFEIAHLLLQQKCISKSDISDRKEEILEILIKNKDKPGVLSITTELCDRFQFNNNKSPRPW